MKEDDENPYEKYLRLGSEPKILHPQHKAYAEGRLHPSPQTIKKIQTNFAEKLKEAMRKQSTHRFVVDGRFEETVRRFTSGEVCRIIDNTLKEKGED